MRQHWLLENIYKNQKKQDFVKKKIRFIKGVTITTKNNFQIISQASFWFDIKLMEYNCITDDDRQSV